MSFALNRFGAKTTLSPDFEHSSSRSFRPSTRVGLKITSSSTATESEPDLSVTVNGLKMSNPFVIGSGPPGTNYTVMKRAFDEGWGGVIAKTKLIVLRTEDIVWASISDATCRACGQASEMICHVLFTCPTAVEAWRLAGIQPPPAGFSQTSVFLNLHFLVATSKKQLSDHSNLKAFPWILWSLWKGRNALVFERNRITPHSTITKALEETEIWYQLLCNDHPPHTTTASPNAPHGVWEKPPADVVKCNVGMAWEASDHISGSSWIVRDYQGKALHHSRQALLGSSSKMESDLRSLLWAVFFEASSVEVRESLLNPYRCPTLSSLILKILELLYCFEKWTIFHVSDQKNKVAKTIAESVISGSWVQSYVASGSPRWLHQMILEDARSV
ncbi:hypothetical protein YC2023_039022 [Brassica napus]